MPYGRPVIVLCGSPDRRERAQSVLIALLTNMTNRMRKRNMPLDRAKRLVAAISAETGAPVQVDAACALRGQRDALARRLRSKLAHAATLARWHGAGITVKRLAAYAMKHNQGEQHA